jgi:ABC-type sugar transport system substrate-binding protein
MRSLRILLVLALLVSIAACSSGGASTAPTDAPATEAPSAETTEPSPEASVAEKIKIGLITKFPVDFFFTIENAAKEWAAAHPDVELITGQGKAGNDHEGQIAIIESMVAQGVQGIAVTPTGPQVQPALDAAVAAGVKIVLIDNDLPDWTGKTAVVATDNCRRRPPGSG